jgi:adenylate cyclase
VLFVDIRGFVKIGEALGPELLVTRLNEFLTGAIGAVEDADGFVSAFTGDGFLAVFGAFDIKEDHADRAWRAASGMKEFLDKLNESRGGEPWKIGVGIHDGELVCAYVGAEDRCTFTVMGDVVNTAARLQETTKEHNCVYAISDAAWQEMTVHPEKSVKDQIPIRGKELPMCVYYV